MKKEIIEMQNRILYIEREYITSLIPKTRDFSLHKNKEGYDFSLYNDDGEKIVCGVFEYMEEIYRYIHLSIRNNKKHIELKKGTVLYDRMCSKYVIKKIEVEYKKNICTDEQIIYTIELDN